MRLALLLSTRYFEEFYGRGLGLDRAAYLDGYRNDWSWDWAQMLQQQGVQTSIYLVTTGRGEHVSTRDGFEVRFLALGGLARPWVTAPVLERSPVGRYLGQAALTAAFLRALRHGLRVDGIDLLCVQEYWTARFDVLARMLEVPIVAVDQGLPDRHEVKLTKRASFARRPDAVVQTEWEARKLVRFGARAVRIPNAVDTDLYAPGVESSEDTMILCVGRLLDRQKRISDAILALAELRDRRSWRLELVGVGPDESMLRALARERGVEDRVHFHGFVADRTVIRDLYRRAAVFALPSSYEGLPMVLLEAMSSGAAVVGSDIPAIAEVVDSGRTGLLVPVGEPSQLAAALRTAAERRVQLGAAARASILATYSRRVVGPALATYLRRVAVT